MKPKRENTTEILPLNEYDKIIVSFSGGKDSLACLLTLLEKDAPKEKLELWHQSIDGMKPENGLMDWPITEDYVRKVGQAFGIPVFFQWRDGGFEQEMLRQDAPTGDVLFETVEGSVTRLLSKQNSLGTRNKFPQTSPDLSVRWCSAYLKIDVAKRVINNDPRFDGKKVLIVTGERREESAARAKYAEAERHSSTSSKRRVDQWRAVIDFTEAQVWDIIARWKVNVHPAYRLGWGRVSCMACIFGDRNQWASVKAIAPEKFARISSYEKQFGVTINRKNSVEEMAASGESFIPAETSHIVNQALANLFNEEIFVENWTMPAGAFRSCGGPQ